MSRFAVWLNMAAVLGVYISIKGALGDHMNWMLYIGVLFGAAVALVQHWSHNR